MAPVATAQTARGQTAPAAARRVRGLPPWLPLALVLAGAYLAMATLGPSGFGIWQDDAVYVITARSLAQGTGYRHLEMPHQPLQTKYPPMLPLLLAGVMRLTGNDAPDAPALHAIIAVSAAAMVLLGWRYLRTVLGVGTILAATLAVLCAISPAIVDISRFLMSELPYAACSLAALLAVDHQLTGDQRSRREVPWAVSAGVLVLAAILTRAFGLSLAAGAVGILLWRRRWSSAGIVGGIVAAGVLAYGAWQHHAAIANGPLQSAPLFSYELDYGLWIPASAGQFARVIWQNGWRTVLGVGAFYVALPKDWVSSSLRDFSAATVAFQAACWVAAGLSAVGFISSWRRGLKALHLYALAYLGMVLAWPCEPYRFGVPWTVFVLYFIYAGAAVVAGRLKRRPIVAKAAPVVLTVVLAGLFLVEDRHIISSTKPSYRFWGSWVDNLGEFDELARWVRAQTPPDAVLACQHTADLHLATGRKLLQAWTYADPAHEYYGPDRRWWSFYAKSGGAEQALVYHKMVPKLWQTYRQAGVSYAIWDGSIPLLDPMRRVALEQPEHFGLRFASSGKHMVVFEVLPPRASGPADAPPPATAEPAAGG